MSVLYVDFGYGKLFVNKELGWGNNDLGYLDMAPITTRLTPTLIPLSCTRELLSVSRGTDKALNVAAQSCTALMRSPLDPS
jgi:hypothetical protein